MKTRIPLLPDEHVVMCSENDILTLTNKRVRLNTASYGYAMTFGSYAFISITLDSVASCGLLSKSHPWLLAAAAVLVFACIASPYGVRDYQLLVLALALVGVYFFTRRTVISITSKGGDAIQVNAQGMSHASIIEFLEAVEQQKLK